MLVGSVIGEIKRYVNKRDDDYVDRIHHKYTVMFISIFMFIISTKQYIGDPIVCWTPSNFAGSHTSFTNAICWNNGSYPVLKDQAHHSASRDNILPYYQWVPFILLFQAFCFMLPNLFWHTFSRSTGVDIALLGKNSQSIDSFDMDKREKSIQQIAKHIIIVLSSKYDYHPMFKLFNLKNRLPFGRRQGNYLYIVYLAIKILYFLNIIFQLVLLNSFFGFSEYSYGLKLVQKIWSGNKTLIEDAFPRITFCDFHIRETGDNTHPYTVQCVLPINLYNEIFFTLLWFWILFLGIITAVNFFSWFKFAFPCYRKKLVLKYLRMHNKLENTPREREMFKTFVDEFCHLDGALMFAIIRRNSNYITASEIISALWVKYSEDCSRFHAEQKTLFLNISSPDSNTNETPEKAPFRH